MDEDKKSSQEKNDLYQGYEPLPWRAWGSWFSWGSPIGLSIFLVSLCLCVLILHYAGLWH